MKSVEVIRILEEDGWEHVGTSGSHNHFKHPTKPGKVTVPHPKADIPMRTLWSIWRQAGLPKRRS
jgi:predicted RNA binding protein YcfA (HicA-like mRNA interferase family)